MAIEVDELAGPDGGDEGRRLAKYWLDQIQTVLDNTEVKRHLKRGESIVKRYRDERIRMTGEDGSRRYGSLWSNVQILKPALYGREPLPVAERRFTDKDTVGRNAASILERALRNEIEICGYHEALGQSVSDYLLPGAGTVWVRYEPQIAEGVSLPIESQSDMRDSQGNISSDPTAGASIGAGEGDDEEERGSNETVTPKGRKRVQLADDEDDEEEQDPETTKLEETDDRVVRESTPVDYVPWNDFFTFPVRARIWKEVTAVGKRVYLSRNQMIRRFGKKIGKAIQLQKDHRGDKTQNTTLQASDQDKGEVFEIWNRDDQTVYWVAIGYDYLCDRKDDPLNLENFYPVPKPIYANPTNNTLIPVPDYIQYEDQAIQIDELTQRIAMLTKAAKITGVYNAAAKDIQRMFQESVENELIPVDDWAAFAEEGGVAGNISFMPLKDIIGLINELVMVKSKMLEDMDRLTGINDIMRGTSDARETLGGVRLKSNSTGTRLTERQNEVARMARDTVRIMADIMCQHFSPQSLIEASGALYDEGLGPDDMPNLSDMQPPAAPPQAAKPPMPGQPPAMPGAPSPQQALPPPVMGQNQPPGAPPAPGAPSQPSNVVPLRPQMPGTVPGQAPAAPPPALNGTILPPQPPVPPELIAKMQALQRIQKAIELLRDQRLRGFRVDIEVDSTIFPDQAQDRQDRTEFVQAVTKYIGEAAALGAQVPEAIPLLGDMLQFAARSYRVGRSLEGAIEKLCDELVVKAKALQQKQANQPNPEQIKAQVAAQKGQTDLAVGKIRAQSDALKAHADIQSTQMQSAAEARQAQAESQRATIDQATEQQNSAADIKVKELEVLMRQMEVQMEQMRMRFEAAQLHKEAMQPPEVPEPARNPAA
jgi:hypothetical protein